MYDPTPAPFGNVTRRWTALESQHRRREPARLLGHGCAGDLLAHVDRPGLDDGACYRQLVPAGLAGESVALGWLATTHRPLLIVRGRALFEDDPTEWGSVCLELLHRTLVKADLSEVKWLRRRLVRGLTRDLSRVVGRHLDQRRREFLTASNDMWDVKRGNHWDPHPDLTVHLDRLVGGLDAPTREALLARANHEPLVAVADRHDLSYAAVRQRVTRARKGLRPELSCYVRAARS